MLRQLARLTRSIPNAGPGALTVAVYATPEGETIPAADRGYEGVACVDDAARLLGLLSAIWRRRRLDPIREWALGLQEFVLWMEEEDGSWLNFVEDWDGKRNVAGVTSSTGENFWQARAIAGLSQSWLSFGDPRAQAAVRRGMARARGMSVASDVRVLHLRLATRLLREEWGDPAIRDDIRRYAEEVIACREGDVLMNSPDERGTPHLWAHVQEGVLADAGMTLGDDRLVRVAAASARALLEPIVRQGFERESTTPYDVASVAFSLGRLGRAEPAGDWRSLAEDARAWFAGRNPAGVPVYDRERGRVSDGIDGTRINPNSGAEANIEAGHALFDDAVKVAREIELGPNVR